LHEALFIGERQHDLPSEFFLEPPVLLLRPSNPVAPCNLIHHLPHGVFPIVLEQLDRFRLHSVSDPMTEAEVRAFLRRRVVGVPDPRPQPPTWPRRRSHLGLLR
jgi:MoxR-like ATPase